MTKGSVDNINWLFGQSIRHASASYNVLKPVLRVNFMMLLVLRGRYGLWVRSCIRAFELWAGLALALLPLCVR